jgi:small subunit ribosomal protein S6
MPLYEHVFLARQDISTQQVEALTKEFSQIIDDGGGKVGKTEYWGLKSLTHKIKKNRKAHYTLMNIDAPPACVAEMERRMGISTDVLRFMTIRVEQHETEPSVQMRKGDRDERGDRGGFRGDRGGFRGGGFRGDRGPREGGFRGDRGPRPDRDDGGFRGPRGPRPDRDDARPPRSPVPGTEAE